MLEQIVETSYNPAYIEKEDAEISDLLDHLTASKYIKAYNIIK